ncbi:MAG: GDSL-type esterase/lipase family protein [Verrucomicrobiota bacterium]
MINGKYLLFSVAVVAGMLVFSYWNERRLNTWTMVNDPPGSGAVLCYGDSLVAGVGAESDDQAYPRWLEQEIGRTVEVLGTPGMTSETGLETLMQTPSLSADVVVVTLGGNDVLRRVPLEQTTENLRRIFTEFQERGALVAFTAVDSLLGSRTKPYRELCRECGVIMIPSVLKNIIDDPDRKHDQIHPNGEGYAIMAERVAKALDPYLN